MTKSKEMKAQERAHALLDEWHENGTLLIVGEKYYLKTKKDPFGTTESTALEVMNYAIATAAYQIENGV